MSVLCHCSVLYLTLWLMLNDQWFPLPSGGVVTPLLGGLLLSGHFFSKQVEFDFNLKDHFKWRSNNMTEIFNYIKWAYRGRWESKKQRVTANIVACITSTFSFLNDISAHLHYINLSIKHLPYVTQSTAHCIAYHTSLTLPGMPKNGC